jgi:hypothetical protein
VRGAVMLFHTNAVLFKRLRDLERLASSWSGSPERQPAILRAREILTPQRGDPVAFRDLMLGRLIEAERRRP